MPKRFNIGIVAHVDAGKTTITEQILGVSGAVRSVGSVDDGTSVTDWMDVERSRGISVSSACAMLSYGDNEICIVDTPGHIDFAGEVERSLSVLDGAILVVSAAEGVQSYTSILWRALEKLGIPVLIAINKIDRTGSDVAGTMKQLGTLTGGRAALITGSSNEGTDEADSIPLDASGREDLLLALSSFDPDIEEMLFTEGDAPDEKVLSALAVGCESRNVFPVVTVCGKYGRGIKGLLDAVVSYFPDSSHLDNGTLSGKIFRVIHDPVAGKVCFLRLFGGSLEVRDSLSAPDGEQYKISGLRRYFGRKYEDIRSVGPGEIAAVCGLAGFKNGDCVGDAPEGRDVTIAEPMILIGVTPPDESARPALLSALTQLTEEEPLLGLDYNQSTREIYIRITGLIQLEIVGELLKERFGLVPEFSEPRVIYRETPASVAKGKWAYVMPKPCWAIVELEISPLPPGSGLRFESVIKEDVLVRRYQHHVETSVFETASQGIYGWQVTDALVRLTDGMSHHVHTHPLDFFVCTPVSFLRALTNAGSVLLEPWVRVTMTADEDLLGRIIHDITDMRGEFSSPEISDGSFTLEALMPLSESVNYPLKFRSVTSGRGLYSSAFDSYRPCPPDVHETLARREVDPLDLDKWILYKRSAIN